MKKGTIALFFMLFAVAFSPIFSMSAYAVATKPAALQGGGADYGKTDSAINKIIDLCAYMAYGLGAIAVAIGFVLTIPVVGQPDLGKKTMKGGVYAIIGAGLLHDILGFIGSLI